jgi:hypothetical protein
MIGHRFCLRNFFAVLIGIGLMPLRFNFFLHFLSAEQAAKRRCLSVLAGIIWSSLLP